MKSEIMKKTRINRLKTLAHTIGTTFEMLTKWEMTLEPNDPQEAQAIAALQGIRGDLEKMAEKTHRACIVAENLY